MKLCTYVLSSARCCVKHAVSSMTFKCAGVHCQSCTAAVYYVTVKLPRALRLLHVEQLCIGKHTAMFL